MHIFVTGATGATGKLLTEELLKRGHTVSAVIRTPEKLAHLAHFGKKLILIEREILSMDGNELAEFLGECDGAASCLGHNISFKGLFGKPRRLVTDAAKLICSTYRLTGRTASVKFVLMNTTGNRNRLQNEKAYKGGDRLVIALLRALLPPQADNEEAAKYLQQNYSGTNSPITWCAVRPDSLIDEKETSPVEILPSPVRSPVFNAGKTSRINVASFMADLLEKDLLWNEWAGKMPVIYNREA